MTASERELQWVRDLRLDPRKLDHQRPPAALPILVEFVPPGGRPLNLFERSEGLGDFGLKQAGRSAGSNYASVYRVHRIPGQEDVFALVRWKPRLRGRKQPGWAMFALPWRLTWHTPHVRSKIRRGDRSTWLTRDDIDGDPMRQPSQPSPCLGRSKRKA